MLIIFLLIITVYTKEIILSAGVDKYSLKGLEEQYSLYKLYKNYNLITGASILAYYLSENGTLETYNNGEELQYSLKINLNLTAYPCLFCDSTIGACDNLNSRLEKVYLNEKYFFDQSIFKAKKYRWNGYYIDFEVNSFVDYNKLLDFILKWSKILYFNNLKFNLWIGDTYYNMSLLYNNKYINLISMTTYLKPYDQVKLIVNGYNNITTNMMYGLLTYQPDNPSIEIIYPNNELDNIINLFNDTEIISLWASNIPKSWYNSLRNYN